MMEQFLIYEDSQLRNFLCNVIQYKTHNYILNYSHITDLYRIIHSIYI